ncbi:hypothetical protein ABPG74_003891 [Tetrahymena malaccensis]
MQHINFEEIDISDFTQDHDKSNSSLQLFGSLNNESSTLQNSPFQVNNNINHDQEIDSQRNEEPKKILVFKRIQKKFRQAGSATIMKKREPQEKDLRLQSGLQISSEGVIRSDYDSIQLSFGYLYNPINIKYLIEQQIVEVQQQLIQPSAEISLKEALNYLSITPCQQFVEASSLLNDLYNEKYELKKKLESVNITEQLINLHTHQLNQFQKTCNKYIKGFSSQNKGAIYQYFVRRINLITKSEEVVKAGYSKTFLDLIGTEVQQFSSNILQNNKIDLVQDNLKYLNQSLYVVKASENQISITTLDGFNLKINYQTEQINLNENVGIVQQLPFQYKLSLVRITVDNQQIQNLILHRQEIIERKKLQSYEDFLQKELQTLLSNKVCNTESKKFIERYYGKCTKKIYRKYKKVNKNEDKFIEKQFQIIQIQKLIK